MATKRIPDEEARPSLGRIALLKAVLQGFRVRLDDELHPLGITTSQLRMLWMIAERPGASGAEIARLCSVTPQTGQASLMALEAQGWIRRHPSKGSDRVLVAELTARGRRVLDRAKGVAERLDGTLWSQTSPRELAAMERVLERAAASLGQR